MMSVSRIMLDPNMPSEYIVILNSIFLISLMLLMKFCEPSIVNVIYAFLPGLISSSCPDDDITEVSLRYDSVTLKNMFLSEKFSTFKLK